MKRSDIYTLVLVAGIGMLTAFFLCNAILGDPNDAKVEFKAMSSVITSDLTKPNEEVFNGYAINPTIEVYVGDCEDADQNGILDMGELAACGRVETATVNDGTTNEELERLRDGYYCIKTQISEEEEKTLCQDEKVEYINGLLSQRGQANGE